MDVMRIRIRSLAMSLLVLPTVACGIAPDVLNARAPRAAGDNNVVEEAPPPLDDAGLAIVWRAGCAACTISTEADSPDAVVLDEQAHRIAVPPVEIEGDLENGFTIVFPEAPPAFVG